MTFPLAVLKESKNKEKLLEILKNNVCDNCLGRQFGMLGHGMTNSERGKNLREYGGRILRTELKEPKDCEFCNNFFKKRIDDLAKYIVKKLHDTEFNSFLIGSIPSNEMQNKQEKLWERFGIEDVEPIKSEINRELGKRIEKLTRKHFDLKSPDITIVGDLNENKIRMQIKSLYIYGKYQKLVRGIPQTKWVCSNCNGKGCTVCKGEGKLYKTSIQEIIEKPLLKATKSRASSMHASGREDIDARNLDWRPFVIELIKPVKRKIDLKKLEKELNKSKKVKVKGLKPVHDGKLLVKKIKTDRVDKSYLVAVEFENKIVKKLLKNLKSLTGQTILQKTPSRVVHRRADIVRKRYVKSISYKIIGPKRIEFKIRAETGTYIKELISGDDGRTNPNVSNILDNKVKSLKLDVIKIWAGK